MGIYPMGNPKLIDDNLKDKISYGIAGINNKLNESVRKIQSELNKVPGKYNTLKNQLSLANEQNKKRTEEYIANTGNHTASGYAMSKRMNNSNAYLKELNSLNKSQAEEQSALFEEMRKAHNDAEAEKNKLISDASSEALKLRLDENARAEELSEKKRMNNIDIRQREKELDLKAAADKREQETHDVDMETLSEKNKSELNKLNVETDKLKEEIRKIGSDIELSAKKDKREEEMQGVKKAQIESDIRLKENQDRREAEIHDTESRYLEAQLQQEYENAIAEGAYIEAKIDTEKSRKNQIDVKTTIAATPKSTSGSKSSGSKSSGSKSSSSGSSSAASSKMSPSQLADNITKQTGKARYDANGKLYYEPDEFKAYTLLMEWKKKFNLSDQVVNDTAIHLGIQAYL